MQFLLEGAGDAWVTIGMIVFFGVIMYFFMIRPQKKQERAANDMRNNLRVGDEITTIGGVIGQIVSIKDETITICVEFFQSLMLEAHIIIISDAIHTYNLYFIIIVQ